MLPFPDAGFCAFNINLYRVNDTILGTIISDSCTRGVIAFSRFVRFNVSDNLPGQEAVRRMGKTAKKCI
jgi:hypothetical protein